MPKNYVLLERTELNATTASVTFANIPQTGYTDLKIVVSARGANSNPFCYVSMGFNGVTTNQTARGLNGTASSASSFSTTNFQFFVNGNTSTASTFSNNEFYIPNYAGSTNKSVSLDGVFESNSTSADNNYLQLMADLWSSTAAITSVTFTGVTGSFVAGSTFSLYGIAALGTTPVIAPKASGGNIIDFDGTNWIHIFTSSGTFTPQTGLTCDYLVIAGGGGGGRDGGGGGAGGYRTSVGTSGGGGAAESPLSLALGTPITVTVGSGGAGSATAGGVSGTKGGNSIFATVTSEGGGGGGSAADPSSAATTGGSGGGASRGPANTTGANGTTNQGTKGGDGTYTAPNYGAAGGGGASTGGGNGTSTTGGNGGAGIASSITGSSVTRGGGGGGGTFSGGTPGSGGAGGGGGASTPSAGTVNTGGGGGGGVTSTAGANGGSGIVIIRYPAA